MIHNNNSLITNVDAHNKKDKAARDAPKDNKLDTDGTVVATKKSLESTLMAIEDIAMGDVEEVFVVQVESSKENMDISEHEFPTELKEEFKENVSNTLPHRIQSCRCRPLIMIFEDFLVRGGEGYPSNQPKKGRKHYYSNGPEGNDTNGDRETIRRLCREYNLCFKYQRSGHRSNKCLQTTSRP